MKGGVDARKKNREEEREERRGNSFYKVMNNGRTR